MQATLPNGDELQLHIETDQTLDGVWFSLLAKWQYKPELVSVWLTIDGTTHVDINRMFADVSQFIQDLESGRKSLILQDNSQLAIVPQ